MIVSSAYGDVNGDGIIDIVYLIGEKFEDSPFIQNIKLSIQDGRTGKMYYIPFKLGSGYNPKVSLYDFTGDGVKNILININSGGSGAIMYYYIFSTINNMPKLLFDYNVFNKFYKYSVIYKDFYKVDIINLTDNIKYIIDISYKDIGYLNEIYNKDGKLKEPIEGFVNPLSGLYPIDFDSDGIYELLAYQKIAGRYNADGLGYIQTRLKWDGRSFVLENQNISLPGKSIKI